MDRYSEEPPHRPEEPDQVTERARLLVELQRGLDTLPLDQRIAFVLCDVEERGSPEVSTIVGAPEATVRTRLFHARKKLREHLEKEGFR